MSSKYKKNTIIDISDQNRSANSFYKYINDIIPFVTAKEDTFTLNFSKRIVRSTPFIYKNLTLNMSELNAARMVQLVLNLSVIAWQWVFAPTSTWFSYYLGSPSGLKKIYQCIFTNPIYGLLFFSSFYLKLIGGTSDEIEFDRIAKILKLPKHADVGTDAILTKIINNTPEVILGYNISGYSVATKELLKKIASGIMSAGSQASIEALLIESLKQSNPVISDISNPAVYISDRDRFDFDDTDIQDQLNFIEKQHTNIKKYIKKYINPKHKQLKKRRFMEIAQVKTPTGQIACLNKCENRVKTQMGCYCEGDCGRTTFLGGKKWCWVDPAKCKKGKYLEKHRGYAYDLCDNKNISKTKKCFTGREYTDCTTK
jgi:hypothetical protein